MFNSFTKFIEGKEVDADDLEAIAPIEQEFTRRYHRLLGTNALTGLQEEGYNPELAYIPTLSEKQFHMLHDCQKSEYLHAWEVLNRLSFEGRLDNLLGKNILNFGCGSAGANYLLSLMGINVLGVDINFERLEIFFQNLRYQGMNPGAAHRVDGLWHMMQAPAKYNIICAFNFGYQNTEEFPALNSKISVAQFFDAATISCAPGGKVLVSSDLLTMDKISVVFRSSGLFQEILPQNQTIKSSCYVRLYEKFF